MVVTLGVTTTLVLPVVPREVIVVVVVICAVLVAVVTHIVVVLVDESVRVVDVMIAVDAIVCVTLPLLATDMG